MHSELFYQLALTLVPNIGDVQAKILVQHFGGASDVFKAKKSQLEKFSFFSNFFGLKPEKHKGAKKKSKITLDIPEFSR